jgi:Pentapeptide repeats (8 copies)
MSNKKFSLNVAHYGQERLYKILTHDAKSAHGGSFDWSPFLPVFRWNKDWSGGIWIPGPWIEHKGDLKWCAAGFHLTSHPLRWIIKKGRIFIAEYDGEWLQQHTGDKTCFRKVRLIAEIGIDSFDLDVKLFKLISNGADLRGADLRGADLNGADLNGAYLNGADLNGAYLKGAYLRGAYIDADPKIKGYKFDNRRLWVE